MFGSHWPEISGAEEGLGLAWACSFSTEGFWTVLPLQQALQGHEVFMAWVGRCIVVRSLWSPWDKAGPCCLGTQQERPPWFLLCQECSGEQPELLAKKCSLLLTFSLFQIFSWKQMTYLEWSLPSQRHRTEVSCEIQSADLLIIRTLFGEEQHKIADLCCSSPTHYYRGK